MTIAPEEALLVSIRGGVRLCVPPFVNQITPYVLLEQEDWFEDEIRFVRRWLKPGMRAVDVGANYGVYTLACAARVGASGRVWAVEPTPQCAAFLRRSLSVNGLAHAQVLETVVSERSGRVRFALNALSETNAVAGSADSGATLELPARTLDELAAEHGWTGIDYVKLDIEGHELQAIRGGAAFLAANSPLVMIEVEASATFDYAALGLLGSLGYAAYRLLPGPLVLVPFRPGDPGDPYQINLFACKPERAALLAREGLLAQDLPEKEITLPGGAWRRYAARAPYAAALADRWPAKAGFFSGGATREYFEALEAFAASRDEAQGAACCWALLERAMRSVETALALDAGASGRPARLVSFARIAWELGRRDAAVRALRTVADVLDRQPADPFAEPFLAPGPRFEALAWRPDPAGWLRCAALEQLEKLRHFSSIFVADGTQHVIVEKLARLPQRSPEMDRRLQLVRMAAGRQAAPEAQASLGVRSEENLNPEFWCSRSR